MKDSYSFDVDAAGLEASFQAHRRAYQRIFDRLGFDYVIVQAMAGAMGGSTSEEFLATAENGEDTYVHCAACGYAANVEAVRVTGPPATDWSRMPRAHVEDTPETATIDTLVNLLNRRHTRADGRAWTAADTLKNVVVTLAHADGSREPLVIGLPGDREVDEKRLAAQVDPLAVDVFDETDFAAHPGLTRGYIGPQVLGADGPLHIRYLLDPRVASGTAWVTGANEPGRHVVDLVAGRDFSADGTIEAAEVREGDACPRCGSPLACARGIEVGHIFQLGTKYAEALELKVLDQNGRLVTVTMGCYGIGPSRAVASVAEGSHDEYGLIWPRRISPADVHVVTAGKEQTIADAAERLVSQLESAGVSVLFDDRRGVSPGVRFTDADLIGIPTIVVVGRGVAEGLIELKDRRSGERHTVAVAEAAGRIVEQVRQQ